MYSSIGYSPFEIVYGFNILTLLDLMPLPVNEIASLDRKRKADLVKQIHELTWQHIEKKNEKSDAQASKGRQLVTFEPGDWV